MSLLKCLGVLITAVASEWLNETTEVVRDIKHHHAEHSYIPLSVFTDRLLTILHCKTFSPV